MKRYFKGYYFKCGTGKETIAFIPALHDGGKESSASLQVITDGGTYTLPYPKIQFGKNKFVIKTGENYFSEKGIYLDADTGECSIHGKLKFGKFQKIRYGIMGPFQYIPFMQCKHSIISMRHTVRGKISINGTRHSFQNGVGYIEGDCGRSFPKEYIWTHCHFENASLMLSVADIPICGFHFTGIIGVVMIGGREYRLATYLGARILSIGEDTVVVRQGKYILSAKLVEARGQKLKAPVAGRMSRTIHESAACKARYRFTCENQTLLEEVSERASFEYEFKKPCLP